MDSGLQGWFYGFGVSGQPVDWRWCWGCISVGQGLVMFFFYQVLGRFDLNVGSDCIDGGIRHEFILVTRVEG